MKTYYEILGVSKNAEKEVITAAYKAMIKKYHPDVNKSGSADREAVEINTAYEILSDPARRLDYDSRQENARVYEVRDQATPIPDASDSYAESRLNNTFWNCMKYIPAIGILLALFVIKDENTSGPVIFISIGVFLVTIIYYVIAKKSWFD